MDRTDFMNIRTECINLIQNIKNGDMTPDDVMERWPENKFSDKDMDIIYHQLGHYACDDDIRARDNLYARMQNNEIEAYVKLLSLEIHPPIFLIDKNSIVVFESAIELQDYINSKNKSFEYMFDSKSVRLKPELFTDILTIKPVHTSEIDRDMFKSKLVFFMQKKRDFSFKNLFLKLTKDKTNFHKLDNKALSSDIQLIDLICEICQNSHKYPFFRFK